MPRVSGLKTYICWFTCGYVCPQESRASSLHQKRQLGQCPETVSSSQGWSFLSRTALPQNIISLEPAEIVKIFSRLCLGLKVTKFSPKIHKLIEVQTWNQYLGDSCIWSALGIGTDSAKALLFILAQPPGLGEPLAPVSCFRFNPLPGLRLRL